jgi:hypothetical protein
MGGAAGHMNHPFDVDWVNSGEDLIDFFLDAAEFLQTSAGSIKWDGINVSFKLVTDESGRKDFRIDRGNQEPMSVIGMTAADAYKKWPKGHGMPPSIDKLLTIFNEALPNIQKELESLGIWEDPTKLFNTEYIGEGGSNVIQYGKNILAIHGVNQFYEKKAQPHRIRQGIGVDRPGIERPIDPETGKPAKGVSVEIDYDRTALESLIQKVQPIAAKYGFSILGDTPTKSVTPIDFESALDNNFPIKLTENNVENFSLREWLREAKNPRDARIITNEGKEIGALSKQAYIAVLNGIPLVDWVDSQKDVEMAINGAVFYHATKELGNAVKGSLRVSEDVSGMLGWDSKFDDASSHEGVILRDPKFGPKPVKITGEFILEGLASTHGDTSKQTMAQKAEPEDLQVGKPKLALLAGGFKPPHKGHLEMVKFYNQQVGPNGKVIILLGGGGKEPRTINGRAITAQDSMNIWDIFLRNEPTIPWPSNKIEFQNVEGAGPIAPIIDYVRDVAPEDQIILLGAGEKDEDRWPNIMANPRNNPRGLEIETTPAPNMVDDNGNPLSARNMRAAVENGDLETFKSYIPDSSQGFAEKIFTTLGNGTIEEPQQEPQEQLQEDSPLPLGIFLGLVNEELNKKRLNEISWFTRGAKGARALTRLPGAPQRQMALDRLGNLGGRSSAVTAKVPAEAMERWWMGSTARIEPHSIVLLRKRVDEWIEQKGVPETGRELKSMEKYILNDLRSPPYTGAKRSPGVPFGPKSDSIDDSIFSGGTDPNDFIQGLRPTWEYSRQMDLGLIRNSLQDNFPSGGILSYIENKYFVDMSKPLVQYAQSGEIAAYGRLPDMDMDPTVWESLVNEAIRRMPEVDKKIARLWDRDTWRGDYRIWRLNRRRAISTYIHDAIKDRGFDKALNALTRERSIQIQRLRKRFVTEFPEDIVDIMGPNEVRAGTGEPYWKTLDDVNRRYTLTMMMNGQRPRKSVIKLFDDEMHNLVNNSWMEQNKEKWAAPEGSLSLVPAEGAQGAVSLTDLNPGEVEALRHQQEMDRYVDSVMRSVGVSQPSQADIAKISAPENLGGTMPNPGERPLPQQMSQTAADLTVPPPQKEMDPEDWKRIETEFFGSPLEELDEGVLSSYKFLQLVEQTLYEANTERSSFDAVSHQANLGPIGYPQWNEEAQENMEKNEEPDPDRIKYVAEGEEEELEEMSSMAAGDVAMGGTGNKPPGKTDDEYLIREEDDDEELIENIVNYLNSEVGVL